MPVHRRRRAGRRRVESARCPLAHERRPDLEAHLGWPPRGSGAAPADDGEGVQRRRHAGVAAKDLQLRAIRGVSQGLTDDELRESSGRCMAGSSSLAVFSGATENRDQGLPASRRLPERDRRCSTTGGHGTPFQQRSRRLDVHAELHHLVDDKSTPARPDRTRWSPSSRWAGRRSSEDNGSARWKWALEAYGAAYTLQES